MLKKILLSPWTALLTLALVVGIRIADPAFVESVRLRYFDTLITAKAPTDNNIVTVNIDEESLAKYGQWPLPRAEYARIVQDLYKRGAGLVVLNVLMPETDRTGGDATLANTMKEYPVVLSSVGAEKNKNEARKFGLVVIGPFDAPVPTYPGIIANVPRLENSAVGIGTTNTLPEIDGVNRRMPLLTQVQDNTGTFIYPSLSMEILRVAAGDTTQQVKLNEYGIEKMRIPKFGPIATDPYGRVWIDWSQRNKTYSLVNLPKDLEGAIVIVGPTAAGIANPLPTAVGAVWPQDVQAAVVGTMFNGVNIQRPDYADGVEILTLALAGILLLFLTRWTYVGIISGVVIIGSSVFAGSYAYAQFSWLFDSTALVVGLVLVMLHAYGVKFVSEFLQKQAIKKQFAGYASPTVVEMLQKNPDLIKKGVKKEVSILFSDLRGFTPLGESFGDDVAGLTKIMNGYMDAITQPVLDADGMIIKYIGDASMHIHNAPIDDPDHPATAVRTGLKMLKAVEKFNEEVIVPQGRPPVGMGAGINTGLGYIGEMGSTSRHSYDVLGDAVSTAARIESKCKEYGCLLLVGGATVEQCKDDFFFLKIDDLAVKGKSVGIAIYTVLDTDAGAMTEYLMSQAEHDKMHEQYRSQDFKGAIKLCKALKGEFDGKMDKYYDMWIERCEFQLTQDLPKDWNGVFIATSK
jgi:adenylate cyclase